MNIPTQVQLRASVGAGCDVRFVSRKDQRTRLKLNVSTKLVGTLANLLNAVGGAPDTWGRGRLPAYEDSERDHANE